MHAYKIIFIILILGVLMSVSLVAKSVPQAMLMSVAIPGTGEIYTGCLSRGIALTTADLVLLFGAYRYGQEVRWLEKSYKQYAAINAGIVSNQSNDYYDLLQDWYSSTEYNDAMELYFRNLGLYEYNNPDYYAASIDHYRISDDDAWQWSSSRTWSKYKSIRRNKQSRLMSQKLAVGAAIANRVISALDAGFLTKKYNKNLRASIYLTPDFINNGAYLTCALEF